MWKFLYQKFLTKKCLRVHFFEKCLRLHFWEMLASSFLWEMHTSSFLWEMHASTFLWKMLASSFLWEMLASSFFWAKLISFTNIFKDFKFFLITFIKIGAKVLGIFWGNFLQLIGNFKTSVDFTSVLLVMLVIK